MASDKRSSAVPKVPVALPKTDGAQSTAQMVPQEAALHAAVGSRVRVSTAAPSQSTVEGTIYVADPTTNLLVLNVSPAQNTAINPSTLHAPPGSYRIIPISQITSFQLQNLPQQQVSNAEPQPSQNTLDTQALQNRLNREVAKLQSAQSRQGPKGTSPADQALFDSLSRTMPTRWHGNAMIISDTYIIEKPYNPASIRLMPGTSGDLDRMKRVLDMEKNKINLKISKNAIDNKLGDSPAAKGSLRKGG
ncbi:hypothetical protein PMZ80_000797 [Knufia obscura]|uniref:AD domain-containing protein n=2 Tax=Knufia TaxID=430999 RepID=A0AAN8EAD0_9EURO|nr:hypothetical protein PMZ80_000797 [Knufia obscura]KAK5949938.1 hypothetical protein OHC33_009123 [Knufia fluminis]